MPYIIRNPFRCDYSAHPSKPCDGVCIPLTMGYHAIVSTEDYDKISGDFWYARFYGKSGGIKYGPYAHRVDDWVPMHRVLFDDKPLVIDHVNGNGLDNRKDNLRQCTIAENSRNRRANRGKVFKGVCLHKPSGKFYARIKIDGRLKYLSSHADAVEAAKAYDAAALKYYSNFANLNFPGATIMIWSDKTKAAVAQVIKDTPWVTTVKTFTINGRPCKSYLDSADHGGAAQAALAAVAESDEWKAKDQEIKCERDLSNATAKHNVELLGEIERLKRQVSKLEERFAYRTECQLATVEYLESLSKPVDLKRHKAMAKAMATECKEFGIAPKIGSRLEQALAAADKIEEE